MNLYVYGKHTDQMDLFDFIVKRYKNDATDIIVTVENLRSDRKLKQIKTEMNIEDILVISEISSLGITQDDICNNLQWFVQNQYFLVICSIPSTYEYGISQPANRAVLAALLQTLQTNHQNLEIIPISRKSNAGRSKIQYPENWEELYQRWTSGEINSGEFIELTGLKRATFYNLVTEYRKQQEIMNEYLDKYKSV